MRVCVPAECSNLLLMVIAGFWNVDTSSKACVCDVTVAGRHTHTHTHINNSIHTDCYNRENAGFGPTVPFATRKSKPEPK